VLITPTAAGISTYKNLTHIYMAPHTHCN